MSELKVNTITEASTGTGITFTNSIVSGNLGTITQRSASSSSPTFSEINGSTINKTNLYGTTPIAIGNSSTHAWIAWDYGAGVARKITKFQAVMQGQSGNTGIFLEGSNVASPDFTETDYSGDWTQLKAFGVMINDSVISYSAPSTATTLKYRHYRIRVAWSSNNGANITKFVLEDTDSTFDIKAPLNATGSAPLYACRAWVNFNGTGTVAIRDSGNVSSITDNGTGDYDVNFTTAMPDSNYAICLGQASYNYTVGGNSLFHHIHETSAYPTTGFNIRTGAVSVTADGGSLYDYMLISASVFR